MAWLNRRNMGFNRALQLDKRLAAVLHNGAQQPDALHQYRGAFIKSLEEPLMQVDLTQHCANAMLRMVAAGVAQ